MIRLDWIFILKKRIKVDRNVGFYVGCGMLIELDWIFILKSGYEFWIACLIAFNLIFGSYRENLIEIHRNSGEKLI